MFLLSILGTALAVHASSTNAAAGTAGTGTQVLGAKKVLLWMANPYAEPTHKPDPITVASMIAHLKPYRDGFTGLAYQYFAICGEGSNDVGGSNDCTPAEAVGMPHLAKGHPTPVAADLGAQLTAGLGTGLGGSPLELWPTISYGNPGNASVLNRLLDNDEVGGEPTYTHAQTHTRTLSHTRTHIHAHIQSHLQTRTHTITHTITHAANHSYHHEH